jgi:hypothetical protein
MQNQVKEWVGYYLMRRMMVMFPENATGPHHTFAVFRGQTVVDPEYRGHHYQGYNLSIIASPIIINKYIEKNPHINSVSFAPLLRPESFILLGKAPLHFPSPFKKTPPAVEKFMDYLTDYQGLIPVGKYAVKSVTVGRISQQEHQAFMESSSPYVKFFIATTGLKEGISMKGLTIRHLVPNNPLQLEPFNAEVVKSKL